MSNQPSIKVDQQILKNLFDSDFEFCMSQCIDP